MPSGLKIVTAAGEGPHCLGVSALGGQQFAQQQGCGSAEEGQRLALEDAGGTWYMVRACLASD